jgi:uncharacterized lipoprotein YddW (UPF0748 family)
MDRTTRALPTDQKVGGSNPSERTKSPGQRLILVVALATIANNTGVVHLNILVKANKWHQQKANNQLRGHWMAQDRLSFDGTAPF